MCVPWTLYVIGYPHNSPSIARGEHDPSRHPIERERESVSSSKRRLLINISSDDDGLAGNAMAIPNAGINSHWCTRNLQTLVLPCIRTRTRAHNTRFISCARRAEMRERERERERERRGEERMRERIRATRSLVNVLCRTVSNRIYPRSLSMEKMQDLPDPIQESIVREKLCACRRSINRRPRKCKDIFIVISPRKLKRHRK